MADVSPFGGEGAAGDADRAQLLLVTGFALAVLLVALALLLNTAIYTENLATRSDAATLDGANTVRESTERGLVGAMAHANYVDDGSYPDLNAAFNRSAADWGEGAAVHAVTHGAAVEVRVVSTNEGTRVTQDAEGPFTAADGSGDWTLVPSTADSRSVRFNVSTTDLHSLSGDGDNVENYDGDTSMFRAVFEEAGGPSDTDPTWELYLYEDGGDVGATLLRHDGSRSIEAQCTAAPGADGHVLVDVENASVGGTDCPGLAALADVDGDHAVRFERAGTDGSPNVRGTYELFVDADHGTVEDGTVYEDETTNGDASPYATYALYTAGARVSYDRGATHYGTTVAVDPTRYDRRYGIGGVLPGGVDAGGGDGGGGGGGADGDTPPSVTVESFTVVDDGGNKHDFTVGWTAFDDTGLTKGQVKLYDPSGNREDSTEFDPNSDTSDGGHTFQDVNVNKNAEGEWRVEVTLFDDGGQSTTDSGTVMVS